MDTDRDRLLSKVPQVTLVFWIVKILATTLGETGGDALSMTLNLGYLVSTWVFLGFFVVTLAGQLSVKRYHPLAYWLVVTATTTVGTTTSDFMDRTLMLGYPRASLILFCGVLAVLAAWRLTCGSVQFEGITRRRDEAFYWVTILVSNTLGTALGDFTADDLGLGFGGGAVLFAALIAGIGALHLFTRVPKAILFWAAYVLTRPLGATVGDILTKAHPQGGLALGRFASTFVIAAAMVAILAVDHLRSRSQRTAPAA